MELIADEVTFWDVPRSTRKHRRQYEFIFLPCICIKLSQIARGAGKIALWLGVLEIYVQIPAPIYQGQHDLTQVRNPSALRVLRQEDHQGLLVSSPAGKFKL